MNRPIIFITIFYILGLIFCFLIFENNFFYLILLFLFISGFITYIFSKRKFSLLILILYFLLGFLLYYFQNLYLPVNHIKNFKSLESIDNFDCVIIQIPYYDGNKTIFNAEIKSVYIADKKYVNLTGKIKITIDNKFKTSFYYGDILNIKSKLKEPEELTNKGEFDYKKYLVKQKIFFTVFTDDTKIIKKGKEIKNYFISFAEKIREKFINIIYSSLPEKEAKILEGVLLGNQRAIPDDIGDKFKKTGTAHILAVSGMNVGLISFFVFLFLKFINIPEKISSVLILFFIWIFALITGFDASIVRATVMASFVLFGLIIERDVDLINTLFSSAFLILLFKTSDLFEIGFQLSYLATFGIIYFIDYVKNFEIKIPDYIKEILFATITAQIFIVPVMINVFHQLSLISLLANFFIVPLSSLITMLGFMMWFIFFIWEEGAKIFGASIFILTKIMLFLVDIFSKIPYAAISVKTLPALFIFIYYLFFIILPYDDIDFEYKKISFKKTTGIFLMIFFCVFILFPDKKFKFYALPVRETNCVFINTEGNKKILIIAYDKNKENKSIRNTVIPFLRYRGINNIDYLILYSISNKKNINSITDNFNIRKILADFEIKDKKNYFFIGNINEMLDKKTKIFINSFKTELEYVNKNIIFEKILTEKPNDKEYIIYACFYNLDILKKVSEKNKCYINSRNRSFFSKEKIPELQNIFDVGEKGMAVVAF